MDPPGKVANPARGQLNRENEHFSLPVRDKGTIRCLDVMVMVEGGPVSNTLYSGWNTYIYQVGK